MAFAFIQSESDSDVFFNFDTALTAGSLFIFAFKWEGATGSGNMIVTQQSGGGTATMLTRVDNASGDNHAQLGYLLTNNGTNAFDVTYPVSTTITEGLAAEFSYTDTPTLDTSNTGSGASGTSLASGAISLDSSATDWLVVGFGSSYSGAQTYSARNINGVAADGFQNGDDSINPPYGTLFWRFLTTSGFSGGTATCTASVSDAWICNVMALKSGTAAGPISNQPETLHVIRSGIRLR